MKKEVFITERVIKKFEKYLHEQERSASTISNYIRELRALQFYSDGEAITKTILLGYKSMLNDRYKPSTVNVSVAAINSYFKFIGRNDIILKPIRVQKNSFEEKDKELSKSDYERLTVTAYKNGDERLALAVQTICSTGIRVSELQYITVQAIADGHTIISCKGKRRTLFLPQKLCRLLMQYCEKRGITQGAVFVTSSGKPLDRSNLWKQMKRLCEQAKVQKNKVYPHNLRHLFARTYYNREKDLSRLADILGHSSINTTRIYTRECGAVHARQIEALGLIKNTTQC